MLTSSILDTLTATEEVTPMDLIKTTTVEVNLKTKKKKKKKKTIERNVERAEFVDAVPSFLLGPLVRHQRRRERERREKKKVVRSKLRAS